jgi:ornithine decarboxylase
MNNKKVAKFLADRQPETPYLIVDLDVVAQAYKLLRRYMPLAKIFYAVKANPAPEVVGLLRDLDSNFDVASPNEIDLCMERGVGAERISFGNTIKKERDIAYAFERGVKLYAFDSACELEKLARSAPGSRVFCRILVESTGAEWPLSRKFGCAPEMAVELLRQAKAMGLDPYGVSFHVGSQQTKVDQWDSAIERAAKMFWALVGDAGVIHSEVVLISRKAENDEKRWVYLDVGKFNGLAETMDEAIRYRIKTPYEGTGVATGPVVLAGPTCDSADILYEKSRYRMPLDLKVGDRVEILSTGAYTSSYASVNFNGFTPLKTYCI